MWNRALVRLVAPALLLTTATVGGQSAGEATLPAGEARGPVEGSVAAALDRFTTQAAALVDRSRPVLEDGRPGLDLGNEWTDLGREWRLVRSELELLTHPSRSPLEDARCAALLDRARFELWQCESALWHSDPNWFARRALDRVAAFPEQGSDQEFLAYARCLASLPDLFAAAERSVVSARPAGVLAARATTDELVRWLSGPLQKRLATAPMPDVLRKAVTKSLEAAVPATTRFAEWLKEPGELIALTTDPLPAEAWVEGIRAGSGTRRTIGDIERLLLDRLRERTADGAVFATEARGPVDLGAIRGAVQASIADLFAEDGEATAVRVRWFEASHSSQPLRFFLDDRGLRIELVRLTGDACEFERARRESFHQARTVASRARGAIVAERLGGPAAKALPDAIGQQGLALAWPALAATPTDLVLGPALLAAAEADLDGECLLLLAGLRRHGPGGSREKAMAALESPGGLSSEVAEAFVDRLELEPLLGLPGLVALEWLEALDGQTPDPRLLKALREVPGVRAPHLGSLKPGGPGRR